MVNKINVEGLTGVSETLLSTLYLRSLETKRRNGIIQDHKSVELVEKIDHNFAKYDSEFSQAIIAIRSQVIDELVNTFMVQHPKGTVINLGSGLCTRFHRLDNGSIHWLNIDLPQVEPVWTRLIGNSERSERSERLQYLAYSILDFAWIEAVKAKISENISPENILFVAEGILMFFPEYKVKQLLKRLQQDFPQSEIIFDALGVFLAQNSRLNSGELDVEATYQWGIKELAEIETWHQGFQLAQQHYYLDRHKSRLGWFGLMSHLPMIRRQVKIGHLKFTPTV